MSTLAVPTWLQSLYEVNHLNRAYDVLAKRERARDSARSQSRRRSSSQTRKSTKLVNAVLPSALTGRSSDDEQEHYAVTAGCRPENINFNRYARLEAYDRTRVIVGEGGHAQLSRGDTPGRYINANWVRELNGGKWWIATQAPLPITLHAFLSVILQPISRPPANLHAMTYTTKTTRVRTVVQLTPNFEGGLQKAHLYFPDEVGQSFIFHAEDGHSAPDLRVTLLTTTVHPNERCVQSTVSITSMTRDGKDETVTFDHMLFGSWPDHGVPEDEERGCLLAFARLVDQVNRQGARDASSPSTLDPDPPIMVGCSAGIGRTGTFITMCSLLRKYGFLPQPGPISTSIQAGALPDLSPSPLGPLPDDLANDPIAKEVDSLREQRVGMVQGREQFTFLYEILALAFITSSPAK